MVTDSMNTRDRLRAVIPGPWHGWLVVAVPLGLPFPIPAAPPLPITGEAKMEALNLDGLDGLNLAENPGSDPENLLGDDVDPKALLWEAGEMAPPEDVAFSLQQLCAAAGENLETGARVVSALERIAAALESLNKHAATAAAALG